MAAVLNNANQFILNKDSARWNSIRAQMEARNSEIKATVALIELERARMEAAKSAYDMQNSAADYALTKIKVANAEAEHCLLVAQTDKENYTNKHILPISLAQEQHKLLKTMPLQTQLVKEQVEKERAQTLDTRMDGLTPVAGILAKQKDSLCKDVETKQYNLDNILPSQLALMIEQRESERAKTLDTRIDGVTPVSGTVGKQKELYTQQIDSFDKDAKYKIAKIYLDGWITQKTLDEGLTAPTELQNTAINAVLSEIRDVNDL